MSIASLIATTLIVGAEPSEAPLNQLVDRWDAECQIEVLTVECHGLAAEIELGLYDLLRKLTLNRQPLDRALLRTAAESNLPALAKLGVSLLGVPKSQEDADALLYAVDHPALAVRYIAARNLSNANNPQWQAMQRWSSAWSTYGNSAPEETLVPDPRPEPAAFTMKSFNGLTFHYYGSDQQNAMFTTTESAESIVKRFGASRRVLSSLDAMTAQMDALQPEMDAAQKEMEAASAANDMERLTAAMKKLEAVGKKMGNVSRVTIDPMAVSQTVILREDKATKRATCTVQVQRDAKLNRTVLLFWREGGWRQ